MLGWSELTPKWWLANVCHVCTPGDPHQSQNWCAWLPSPPSRFPGNPSTPALHPQLEDHQQPLSLQVTLNFQSFAEKGNRTMSSLSCLSSFSWCHALHVSISLCASIAHFCVLPNSTLLYKYTRVYLLIVDAHESCFMFWFYVHKLFHRATT